MLCITFLPFNIAHSTTRILPLQADRRYKETADGASEIQPKCIRKLIAMEKSRKDCFDSHSFVAILPDFSEETKD